VVGTIAASVNSQGTVGVAPNVKIMALKVCGWNSDFIAALQYASSEGVKITNYSWWGSDYSQAAKDAIDASGQLFVAPAGNADHNDDVSPTYPASYNPLAGDLVWTFTTAAPPRVISYAPTRTTGVPRDTRPTASFYAISMDEATITATNIKLQVYKKRTKTWASVAHTVAYDAINKKATVVPDTRLGASRQYRVTVTTRVKNSAGVGLDQDSSTPGNQPKT
jgi:hypothetical protein